MKKYIRANAPNIADEFNQITKFTLSDGLITVPNIFLDAAGNLVISPFVFVHGGVIVVLDSYTSIADPYPNEDHYIYVDSKGPDESAGIDFVFSKHKRENLTLVAQVINGNFVFPTPVSFPELRKAASSALSNDLKGSISFDPVSKTITYSNLVHIFGIDSDNIGDGSITAPDLYTTSNFTTYLAVRPDQSIISWGAVGTDEEIDFAPFALDYLPDHIFSIPLPAKNATLLIYRSASAGNVQASAVGVNNTNTWAKFAGPVALLSQASSGEVALPHNVSGKDALVAVITSYNPTVDISFFDVTYDATTPAIVTAQAGTTSINLSGTITAFEGLEGELAGIFYFALIVGANLVVLRYDNNTGSVTNVAIESLGSSYNKLAMGYENGRLHVVCYDDSSTNPATKYIFDATSLILSNTVAAFLPAIVNYYDFKFDDKDLYEVYYVDDGTNAQLFFSTPLYSRRLLSAASPASLRINTLFVENDCLGAIETDGVIKVFRVSNFKEDIRDLTGQLSYNWFSAIFMHTGHLALVETVSTVSFFYFATQTELFNTIPALGWVKYSQTATDFDPAKRELWIERKFDPNVGHRHTGAPGDAPQIGTSGIEDGAITTIKLQDNAVTTSKIQDGSVTTAKLADGSVTTNKITNNAVTLDKIADDDQNPNPNTLVLRDVNGDLYTSTNVYFSSSSNKITYNSGKSRFDLEIGNAKTSISFDPTNDYVYPAFIPVFIVNTTAQSCTYLDLTFTARTGNYEQYGALQATLDVNTGTAASNIQLPSNYTTPALKDFNPDFTLFPYQIDIANRVRLDYRVGMFVSSPDTASVNVGGTIEFGYFFVKYNTSTNSWDTIANTSTSPATANLNFSLPISGQISLGVNFGYSTAALDNYSLYRLVPYVTITFATDPVTAITLNFSFSITGLAFRFLKI